MNVQARGDHGSSVRIALLSEPGLTVSSIPDLSEKAVISYHAHFIIIRYSFTMFIHCGPVIINILKIFKIGRIIIGPWVDEKGMATQ
jgi:hypothetical protein